MYSSSGENNRSILTTTDCSLSVGHSIALVMINSLAAVLGTFGNFLVSTAVLYVNPRLRSCAHYLLVSLAIADLIVTMVSEPLFVAVVGKRAFAGDCAANLGLAFLVSSNLSCAASVMHLAGISLDRFIAVIFPLRHDRIMKNYGLKTMLIVAWGAAFAHSFLRFIFLKETFYWAVLVSFVVSYALIIGCYLSIVVFLAKEKKRKDTLRAKQTVAFKSKS